MSYFTDDSNQIDYMGLAANSDVRASHQFASEYTEGLNRSLGSSIGSFIGGATVDLADTVSSSVGLTDRGEVNNMFLGAVGSPGLQGFYAANKGAIEVGSGVAGIILADMTAARILKPAGAAMRAIRNVPYARKIATLDQQYDRAVRLATATNASLAARGAMGVERFASMPVTLSALGARGITMTAEKAASNVYRAGFAKAATRGVATEAVMAATLNENEFLYSDDLAHNVAWGLAGIGIAGGIQSLIDTHTLRKIANSDRIRRLNANALDVTGGEAQRVHSMSVADSLLKAADGSAGDMVYAFQSGGATTDRITSLAISASELQKPRGITERARSLFGKREALATPQLVQAHEELNKVTVRGLTGISKSGFGTKMEGLGNVLRESMTRDPAFFYGIEELATTVEGMTRSEVTTARAAWIDGRLSKTQKILSDGGTWVRTKDKKTGEFTDRLKPLTQEERDALVSQHKQLQFQASGVPVTMLEAGEWVPVEFGRIADNYNPRQVQVEGGLGADNKKIWTRSKLDKKEAHFGIDSDGELYLPERTKIDTLKIEDALELYHVANRAVRDMAAAGHVLQLPQKPNWFQLDMAERLVQATGDEASVKWPADMTRQRAQVESFAQKVSAIRKKENAIRAASKSGVNQAIDEMRAFELKVQFNLPRMTSYQQGLMGTSESPIDLVLASLRSGDEVRQMNHQELLQLMNDSRKIASFTDETKDTLDGLQGNSFNFLMDRDGVPIKPIVGIKRPMSPMDYSRDEMFARQTMKAAHLQVTLTGETADPITRAIVQGIMSNPNVGEARKVLELADDQSRSFVPGFRKSAPQTTRGSFMNSITSRERRDVDNLTMRAASKIKETETRLTQGIMMKVIQDSMGDVITRVNSPRAVQSKLLLNQFHSFRPGWTLKPSPIPTKLEDGSQGYAFALDETNAANKEWFKERFGRELKEGDRLMNPNGTEIVLDELGMEALERSQLVYRQELEMKNTLLRSQDLAELKEVPYYAPPPNDKGKYVAYVFDEMDNVIPGQKIVAATPEDLTRQIAEADKNLKPGHTIRQRTAIQSFMNMYDKAQMEFIAPNVTAIQPKKHNFGMSGEALLNSSAFDESLLTMRDNLIRHGTDLLEVLFDDPIKAAKSRAQIARVESGIGSRAAQHSSIYDRYVENLLGRNALGAKDSFFGDAYAWAENRLNGLLANTKPLSNSETFQAFKDFVRFSGPANSVNGERFDKLSKALGKHMPYKSVTEMVERETKSRTPTEVAAISQKLSWFEAASRLRWFESMHAVANIGSLAANMPSVVKALQPMAGETMEQAAARNSSLAMMKATPDGTPLGLLNVPKLLWESSRDAWKKVPDEFTKRATALGYMDQEVAEFQRAWGAIDSKEGWRGFMFGNEAAAGTGIGAKVARSGGLDKWLGVLSDRSEGFSRQWGMYAGKRLAEAMGIHNIDEQIDFAHDITNKLIANYDPRNRPEIFQGALGAPIGLFQSYVLNFYQRMFRYMETSNMQSLATQYATQGAIFGSGSLPGWDALNWAFFDRGKVDNEDPVESIYARFGQADGDLIMHGVLSNLPKLFGADGMSLYTRGDAQFRMPVVNLPVADTLSRVWGGLMQGVEQVKIAGGLTPTQTAEIVSNMLTNRPIAGMIETFGAKGFDTSWDGQVVSQSKGLAEQTFRMLGVRSMRQQKEIDHFYANKNAQEEQNARKTALRTATRALVRDERYDEIPAMFAKYVQEGGDPRYYTRWVKEVFATGLDSRGERMLKQALKKEDGSKDGIIARLLDAQIEISEDATATEDYGRDEMIRMVAEAEWDMNPDQPQSTMLEAWETEPSPTDDPFAIM